MQKELLKIGAAYIRVSDERQDEYSPDSQLKKIMDTATREGYLIPEEYVFYDDGISGKSTKNRDAFNRMIALAKEKERPFDRIYIWKFSRFARNQEESLVYKNLLRKKKVSVVSVSEPIPEGPFGSLIERIIEWMDEFYIINLGEEVMRGMTEKASRGEPICAPPFGYTIKEGKYYPDEDSGEADVVRQVFSLYASGVKQREIARILAEKGIRTRAGKVPENRWVDYMLHNHCYIGKIRWCTDGSRSVSKRKLDNENIMITDGQHEPIISSEVWDKVQQMLEEQKRAYPKYAKQNQKVDYMLKGLVRCSNCGGPIAAGGAKSGKAQARCLQCCNYSKGSCRVSHSITLPKLEKAFIAGLRQAVGECKFTVIPKIPKGVSSDGVDYEKQILLEQRKLERAKAAYFAEIDSIEQYAQNKKEITERIERLKTQRDTEVRVQPQSAPFTKRVMGIVEFIEREDVTPTEKNEALRAIISKVVYEKGKGNLSIYFRDL